MLDERFWGKVKKTDDCWIWTASRSDSGIGYGQFWLDGKLNPAHRLVYAEMVGIIPRGMFVCHHCDNRACVNPDHLFLATHGENMRDMTAKGRRATKVTPKVVDIILRLSREGLSSTQIAAVVGICDGHVRKTRKKNEAPR